MEIEISTGIIGRQGQNWNTCLTPHGAAMSMWMCYTARFKLKVVVTRKHGALEWCYPVHISISCWQLTPLPALHAKELDAHRACNLYCRKKFFFHTLNFRGANCTVVRPIPREMGYLVKMKYQRTTYRMAGNFRMVQIFALFAPMLISRK